MPRRTDRIRALAAKRRQRVVVWVELTDIGDGPPLDLKPGQIRQHSSGWWRGRSEDGEQGYVASVLGSHLTEEECVAHVREVLAQRVVEAATKPKNPRTNPKPTGRMSRTLAAREAVAVAKAAPTVTRTRLAKCAGCGPRQEVPADVAATCDACGGDL
jgi:hypothetical protein